MNTQNEKIFHLMSNFNHMTRFAFILSLVTFFSVNWGCGYERIDRAAMQLKAVQTEIRQDQNIIATNVTNANAYSPVTKKQSKESKDDKADYSQRTYALIAMADARAHMVEIANTVQNFSEKDSNCIIHAMNSTAISESMVDDNLIVFAADNGKPCSRDLIVKYRTREGLWLMTVQMQDYCDGASSAGNSMQIPEYKCVFVTKDESTPLFYYDSKSQHSELVNRNGSRICTFNNEVECFN
ncbi:MAG: hypothetical protein IPO27_01210 [Bacteroidetes bacterium]|nr:hypothetical protein [Bacteroidota bacterium]